MKTIRCDISIVMQIEEDVILIDIVPDKDFEMKDFNQLFEAAREIGGGKKFYNLVNVGEHTTPSHEARVASTSVEGSIFKKADAFVIHSYSQKFIANFYLNFHKPVVPTRFFNSMDQAKQWIAELQKAEREAQNKESV